MEWEAAHAGRVKSLVLRPDAKKRSGVRSTVGAPIGMTVCPKRSPPRPCKKNVSSEFQSPARDLGGRREGAHKSNSDGEEEPDVECHGHEHESVVDHRRRLHRAGCPLSRGCNADERRGNG